MTEFAPHRRGFMGGVASLAVLAASGLPARARQKWDFTIYYGPGHVLTKLYQGLAADLGKNSGGELDVTVRTAGELPFRATEAVTVCGQGQVDMALGYNGFIAGTTKIAALPGLPFLVRDAAEAEKAMQILVPYVDAAVGRLGAKTLMWNGQHWPQNLYGKGEPVTSLDQLKGLNARGSSPEQGDVIRHYGGAPVTLTTAEVPEAMERGVMTAVFTGAANILGSKWTEFLDWGYFCAPNTGIEYILINQATYDGLSADLRKVVEDTVAAHRPTMAAALKKANDDAEAQLRGSMKIADATPSDVARYQQDFAPYWDKWAEAGGPETVEALKKVREALGK